MSKKNEAQAIAHNAEVEVRLARVAIANFTASPKVSLKGALMCIGEVKSHLDRAGVFHERFNFVFGERGTFDIKKAKGVLRFVRGSRLGGNRDVKTHRQLATLKGGK